MGEELRAEVDRRIHQIQHDFLVRLIGYDLTVRLYPECYRHIESPTGV